MEKKFNIEGMTCSACQAHVQKAVEKLDGLSYVNVNLLKNTMDVKYDESLTNDEIIKKAVENAGYKAYLPTENKDNKVNNKKDNKGKNLIISAIFGFILFYIAMGPMLHIPVPNIFKENPLILAITEFLLTLPVIYLNRHYYINGYKRLFKLSPNMDSLIAIGSSASLIYGIYVIYQMAYNLGLNQDISHLAHELYFESASMILVLVSFGKYLESKSKNKTNEAIEHLMDLVPKTAILLKDNKEIEIPVEQVKLDDILIIKKGMQVPVDGIIIEGSGSLNQSNITGESIPVYKSIDDEVISSTILTNGYLKIKATKIGENTTINTIIKLVEEASNSKAPISKLADKISFFFVPTVIGIALISFILFLFLENFTFAFGMGISVLVIACPCALGLATPVAIMVSTGVAAKNGLLIKNAEILEKTHSIKTVILDKTGTITEGNPKVMDIIKYTDKDILKIAYSLELKSEHPLALAIINKANESHLTPYEITDYNSHSGLGIEGVIENETYYIGNSKFIESLNITINTSKIESLTNEGKTPLLISNSTSLLGIITVKDTIKKDSKQAIKDLKSLGIEVVMLTGDNASTANAIAKELGIDNVISDVLPNQKQDIVKNYQTEHNHVAMVGDGVNDAPALMSADIGIAIGNGTDIAMDAADIILASNSLTDVYHAIRLSKRTINNIKGNLFWAFFYNAIGIVLASGVLYYPLGIRLNPMIGALAMSFSSVFVVTNALRLNTFNKNKKGEKVKMEKITINVEGMMCMHCHARVEKVLKAVPGVTNVVVSLENKNAIVEGENITRQQLIQVVVDAGYEAN